MARPNRITPEMERRILELRSHGHTLRDIAAEVGCSHRTAGRHLRALHDAGVWQTEESRGADDGDGHFDLDSALNEFADWIGSDEENAARSRHRRGAFYDCGTDTRIGSEGFLSVDSIS